MSRRNLLTAAALATGAAASLLLAGPAASAALAAGPAAPPVLPGTITRVDNRPNGEAPNHGAGAALLSGDGHYAVFSTDSYTLTSGDRNDHSSDVFLYDAQTRKTVLVSHNAAGQAANGVSYAEGISTDGRFLLYVSTATDLSGAPASNPYQGQSLYRYTIATGANQLVTPATLDTQQNQQVSGRISATGRYVVLTSATSLLAADTNGLSDVYLWDGQTGRLSLVSTARTGGLTDGDSFFPDVSADGHVTYLSNATDIAGTNPRPGADQVYLWNPATRRATMLSRNLPADTAYVTSPEISDNAAYVTFTSATGASDLQSHLYSVDNRTGRRSQIIDAGPGYTSGTAGGSMSATGRYVVIEITNDLPTSNDAFRNRIDIFDRQTGTFGTVIERPDVFSGSISGDGNHLSLFSSAADLVTPDTNGVTDGFLWTRS